MRKLLLAALALGLTSATTSAQIPDEYTNLKVLPADITRSELLDYMRSFSLGTGFRCNDCHVAEDPTDFSTFDFASDEKREKRIAREMLTMVQRINEEVLPGLPERATPEVEVRCVTCHARRARPATLAEEMTWALEAGGPEAIRNRYDELREAYFGRGAYDFGSGSLDTAAQIIFGTDPEAALAVTELNLEHHPESFQTWGLKGSIHEELGQNEEAIEAFERSLEIQPTPQVERALRRLRGGE